jgi:hypothetical protein
MNIQFLNKLVLGGVLTGLMALGVAAQEASSSTSAGTTAAAAAKPATASGPISDILKLLDAGVSKDIIKAYVEKTLSNYQPSAADIITLKQHGVTDDVTAMLLARTPEPAAAVNPAVNMQAQSSAAAENAQAGAAAPTYAPGGNAGYLDPEGYNYFQYYYLYPRTLAWANQQLYGNNNYGVGNIVSPYYGGYGFYGPTPFSPYPPSVFAHPRTGARINGTVRVTR